MNVLVTAASQQGSTVGIAEEVGRSLRTRGLTVDIVAPGEVRDVSAYDAFVIGSALYMGHWLEPSTAFVQRFSPTLLRRPVWLFSSGPVGDPARKLVQKMTADPAELPQLLELTGAKGHRIFAGKLVASGLPRPQRLSLKVFRGMEGDWRDWVAIDGWAGGIAASLARDPVEAVTPV